MPITLAKKRLAGLFMASLLSALSHPIRASADHRADTFKSLESDSADHSCQVVLRSASIKIDPTTGLPAIETDSNGDQWFIFESLVDAASAPLVTGTSVNLLYRSSDDPQWHSAPGLAVTDAPQGMQRFVFRVSHSTLLASKSVSGSFPDGTRKLYVIPFMQTTDGRRIFDHNSTPGDVDSVVLDREHDWSFTTNASTCPTAGRGSSTLRFLSTWTLEQRGQAQPGQSLFIDYDLSRLPQCQDSSYNGLPAWQTDALIRFYPSGEEFSASLSALQNGKMISTTARFEIPQGATYGQIWFRSRGRNCDSVWDSNYGRNYEIGFRANAASAPSWAGQWKILSGSAQCLSLNRADDLPEAFSLTDSDLKSCRAIQAEVLVPGLTTAVEPTPEFIQAQVKWSLDGVPQKNQWLTYAGRSGQNYRFQWFLPQDILNKISWHTLDYSFQFSTDGLFWLSSGRQNSHHNGIATPRTIEYRISQ